MVALQNTVFEMKELSPQTLKYISRLVPDAHERDSFIAVLMKGDSQERSVLWLNDRPEEMPFRIEKPFAWQPSFVDRVSNGVKPGAHPLHEQGAYYCLDLSSVFAASSILSLNSLELRKLHAQGPTILDVCAAPGGKSIFAWQAIKPELLICNEVIGKRSGALISNLKRCRILPSIVIREDSKNLAEKLAGYAELVLVDAPCSGQSLLAKGEDSPGCFHPSVINTNANRQRRILANSSHCVSGGGYLVYMTCTYAREENEGVVEWFFKKFPCFKPVAIPSHSEFQSELTSAPCYRLWPQKGMGAGAFVAMFECQEQRAASNLDSDLRICWSSEN